MYVHRSGDFCRSISLIEEIAFVVNAHARQCFCNNSTIVSIQYNCELSFENNNKLYLFLVNYYRTLLYSAVSVILASQLYRNISRVEHLKSC